ncbi:MAG: sugar phosphate isomerase/epimerase family protein, partial [Gemmiger sp.]
LGKVAADGFRTVQLAYKKAITGVGSYADVTPDLVAQTTSAIHAHGVSVSVLGAYVELALDVEEKRTANVADFTLQLPVCKDLGALCVGCETTNMAKQPAGTSRRRAQYMLCKSLEQILPEAERLGVNVAIEPVSYHSMNTPEATRYILDTMQSPNLKVIFDPANLLTDVEADRQTQLWDRVGTLLGDRLVAVHFKGQDFETPDRVHRSTSLEESVVDYAGAFAMLRTLPQTLPVLREEAVPARAASDIRFMSRFFTE